jgi:hypothetical protein
MFVIAYKPLLNAISPKSNQSLPNMHVCVSPKPSDCQYCKPSFLCLSTLNISISPSYKHVCDRVSATLKRHFTQVQPKLSQHAACVLAPEPRDCQLCKPSFICLSALNISSSPSSKHVWDRVSATIKRHAIQVQPKLAQHACVPAPERNDC